MTDVGHALPLPVPLPAAHLTVFRGANSDYVAVFVEGPDDVETLRPWLKWRPLPVGGCQSVVRAVSELHAAGERGFLGIIDANCERLEGRDHANGQLIITEAHDLECDLLRSPVLDRFLESIDDDLLRALTGERSFRDLLVEHGTPFGLLRWHFFRLQIAYPAGRLSPHRFIDADNWSLNREFLLQEAAASLNQSVPDVEEQLSRLAMQGFEPWAVCNGHDLIGILCVAMRGRLMALSKYPQSTALATALRLSIDSSHLDSLHVWRALKAWERSNTPWTVCR